MILPSKFVSERIMFTVDFGDRLPWGSVVTLAKIIVEVFSGVDTVPQRVFSQVYSIDGTKVTFQVKAGLAGVIYNLITAVQVATKWYYFEMKLAVLPDSANLAPLYPLTRVFTSLPYVQFTKDEVVPSVFPTGGLLLVVLYKHPMQPDNVNTSLIPTGGDLFVKPVPPFIDKVDTSLLPTNGALLIPPIGNFFDKVNTSIVPTNGALFLPPLGTFIDKTNTSLVPTNGALYIP